MDRGNSCQRFIEQSCVSLPTDDMFFQPRELGKQDRGLKFRHAEITAQIAVVVPSGAFGATAVRKATTQVGQVFVIRHKDATFPCRDILGDLKTERATTSDRPGALTCGLA